MEYIKKICPVCGNEFVVLKCADDKAVYCTLECLSEAQGSIYNSEILSPLAV